MPKPDRGARLRGRVKFQRRKEGDDKYGNPVEGWEDLGIERDCELTPTRGGESVQAGRLAGQASWDCWVRYDPAVLGVNEGDRAVEIPAPQRAFDITFIGDMDGDGRWILVQLKSGGVSG